MTPLFLALIMIEIADLIFAVDSVPAIFAITTDPFIVYTSNIFAILGLRALYFALAALVHRFHYLKYALSVLLVFIGSKIFLADWLGLPDGKFLASRSLRITFAILFAGIGWSLWKTRERAPEIRSGKGEAMKAVATAGPDRREGRERSVGPMRKGKGLERQGRCCHLLAEHRPEIARQRYLL